MTPSRLRLLAMALVLAGAGVVALAWSQTWYVVTLQGAELAVGGDTAGAALLALALASLALLLALALAGTFFRVVLGVLDALLGVSAIVVAAWSLSDPVRASFPALVEATGISSLDALRDAVAGVATTPWPAVGIIGGVLMVLTGLGIAVTARAWPQTGSRFTRVRATTLDGDPIRDWDALSEGEDPTAPR